MKKIVITLVVALTLVSCTQTKVGYIDIEEVMKDYDATKLMEDEFKLEQDQMGRTLDSLSAPFQAKVQEFNQNADTMPESKRQAQLEELQQEQQQLQQQQQQAQQYMQQKSMAELEVLTKKVDSVVTSYAIANGFQMVIGTQGTGTVMYGQDELNLSETIIDLLNAEFEENSK